MPRAHTAGCWRRDPTDRRHEDSGERSRAVGLHLRRSFVRRRRQTRIPDRDGRTRPAKQNPWAYFQRLFEGIEALTPPPYFFGAGLLSFVSFADSLAEAS